MKRRDFVRFGCATVVASKLPLALAHPSKTTADAVDFTLQIAPMTVELAPRVVISTLLSPTVAPGLATAQPTRGDRSVFVTLVELPTLRGTSRRVGDFILPRALRIFRRAECDAPKP